MILMNEQLNEHWLLQLHSFQSENTKSTISIKCFKCKWIRNTKENWLSALFKWTFMSIISLRAGRRHLASFPLNDQNINTSFLCWSDLGTADPDPNQRGKKGARKTTQAGGGGADLARIAAEQQEKLQKEREERMEQLKQIQAEKAAAKEEEKPAEEGTAAPEPPKPKSKPKPKPEPKTDSEGMAEEPEPEPEVEEEQPEPEEAAAPPPPEEETPSEEPRKRVRTGPLVPDTIIGTITILIYHFH